jgi:hypothetical protein
MRLWDDHKALLAATLRSSEWYAVAGAYQSLEVLRAASQSTELLFTEDGHVYHTAIADLLVELAGDVQAGAKAVSRLAGNPDPDEVRTTLQGHLARALRERATEVESAETAR